LSIGELAKETSVKVVTIRYYERIGILPVPERTAGNYRRYSEEHSRRLRFIRRCRDLGFSLDQVRGLVQLASGNSSSCTEICQLAGQHLKEIKNKLDDLIRLESELRRISASCNGNRPVAQCRIMEALAGV
jgi:DNA-binding transcriptional MerR regulator